MTSCAVEHKVDSIDVLNMDLRNSTATALQLISQKQINNHESFIISNPDEPLLINISFMSIIDLKSITFHSFAHRDNDEISSPKKIYIFKANKATMNVNDLLYVKSDRSINCSSAKLQKGQKINLQRTATDRLKFKSTKFISIYIESNQNSSDRTWIHRVTLNGDIRNKYAHLSLQIGTNRFHKQCKCESITREATICNEMKRIKNAHIYYTSLDLNDMIHDAANMVHYFNKTYKTLLGDYMHIIIRHHVTDNKLINHDHVCKLCINISECVFATRHLRQRKKSEIFGRTYNPFIFWRDIMDSLHCYLCHLDDNPVIVDIDHNTNCFTNIRKVIQSTRRAMMHRKRLNVYKKQMNVYNIFESNTTETVPLITSSYATNDCNYILWVQRCRASESHGYYQCIGVKNGRYHFQHKEDHLAELYCDYRGCWMVIYDRECLYKSRSTQDNDPPLRNWQRVHGSLPLPNVSQIALHTARIPMVVYKERKIDKQQEQHNKLLKDEYQIAIDVLDFKFNGAKALALCLNMQDDNAYIEISKVKKEGQAKELGVFEGDILLKLNDVQVSKQWKKAVDALKSLREKQEILIMRLIRRKVEDLVICVKRAGSDECNGNYTFYKRNEEDAMCPIYRKKDAYTIKRVYHEDNESLWIIANEVSFKQYYLCVTASYLPPQFGWQIVPNSDAKYPAPGLQFACI